MGCHTKFHPLLLLCVFVPAIAAIPNAGNIISNISVPDINSNVVHGIAASRRHQDVIYTLLTSGGQSVVHILGANTGKLLGTLNVTGPGLDNCTWDDIAVGPSREHDHDSFIYIADIAGDAAHRCNLIYRVQEPETVSGDVSLSVHGALRFRPGAGRAASLMVDEDGVVWLVAEGEGEAEPRLRLFMIPIDVWLQTGVVDLGAGVELPATFKDNYPTGGGISADGRWIILKSQNKIFGYVRDIGTETIQDTLVNRTAVTLEDVDVDQGVVVSWDLDGQGYYLLSQHYVWYFTNSLRFNTGPEKEHTGIILSTVSDPRVNEASGVAASRRHADILYTHNDSGDPPYVYVLRASTGELVARLNLTGFDVENCDWEDIAVGPASAHSDASYIYIGDIGGNFHKCDIIYRVQEPETLPSGDVDVPIDGVVKYSYTAANSETLMVDGTGVVWIVSKVDEANHPHLFKIPVDAWSRNETVDLGSGIKLPVAFEHEYPTGGDISPDGLWVILKGYTKVFIYYISQDQTLEETLVCTSPTEVGYYRERQGEGVSWDMASGGYYTLSEGRYQSIWYYENTVTSRVRYTCGGASLSMDLGWYSLTLVMLMARYFM